VTIQLPYLDLCAIAPSAFTYWVPQTQGAGMVATSGSGGYYYTSLCKAFVVDIKMATYSATDPVDGRPTNPSGELIIATEPFDLPSSQALGGTTPIVGEDCGRLKHSARYYRRLHNEDHFTHLADFKAATNWDSPVCDVTVDGGSSRLRLPGRLGYLSRRRGCGSSQLSPRGRSYLHRGAPDVIR